MGNTCKPMAVSFQCMTKSTTNKKNKNKKKMVGWHHQINGHELEQILEDSEGQGILTCCSLWATKRQK